MIKIMKIWLALFVSALLSGCAYVPGPVYVHEETDELRRSMYSGRVDGAAERDFVLIPDFRTFTDGFDPRSSYLRILSKEPIDVIFNSVTFRRPGTHLVREVMLDQTIQVNYPFYKTGYYSGALGLLGAHNSEGFVDSPRIDFDLTYTRNGVSTTESFSVELITRWVWTGPDGGEFR
jgi:hypothetical protein